jgi:integrase
MPASHKAEEFVDAYLASAGFAGDKKSPLFLTAVGKTKTLTEKRMNRCGAYRMIRRAADAGIETAIGCHSSRATAITNYLKNGGSDAAAVRGTRRPSTSTAA